MVNHFPGEGEAGAQQVHDPSVGSRTVSHLCSANGQGIACWGGGGCTHVCGCRERAQKHAGNATKNEQLTNLRKGIRLLLVLVYNFSMFEWFKNKN